MTIEDGAESVSAAEGRWVPVEKAKYVVKKWVKGIGTPVGDPDGVVKDETTLAESRLQQPIDQQDGEPAIESRYGEKQELDLEQIAVGDYIHLQTASLSLYVVEVKAKGPDYITGNLVHSSGPISTHEAQGITINNFPLRIDERVILEPSFSTSELFHLGLDNKINLELFQLDEKKEAAIRLAIDALKSAHPTLQEIEKALDTLIAQGRQINDADKRIEANPGREQRKIQQVFSQFRASIDTIDDELLQVILDRAGITKAFSLDEKIAEAMQNSLYLVLERREKNGFGGALTGLVNSIKKALT